MRFSSNLDHDPALVEVCVLRVHGIWCCLWMFIGKRAWNMTTACGYVVVKNQERYGTGWLSEWIFCLFITSAKWVCTLQVLLVYLINPWTAGVSGWISDSCCSLKPLWSGMGEVVPARTSPTLHPPSSPTVLLLSCLKSFPVHQLSRLAL